MKLHFLNDVANDNTKIENYIIIASLKSKWINIIARLASFDITFTRLGF